MFLSFMAVTHNHLLGLDPNLEQVISQGQEIHGGGDGVHPSLGNRASQPLLMRMLLMTKYFSEPHLKVIML